MNVLLIHILQAINSDSTRQAADSLGQAAKEIITNIASGEGISRMEVLIQQFLTWSVSMGGRIVGAVIIFTIGHYFIKFVNKLLVKVLTRDSIEPGVRSFLKSLVNTLLMTLLLIAVINKLGIETTSFAALLASFGVAIGMAMSGNLSNFVGGMIILLFKPYRVGDLIEANGETGHVVAIEIFHTILKTYGGVNVYMANGNMSTAVIKNYSKNNLLRVEFKVSVEYGQDLSKVEAELYRIAQTDARVLKDPAPHVNLEELAASSVDLTMKVWVKDVDYWSVKYDINRNIYDRFNEIGISFPFPQLTIHQD